MGAMSPGSVSLRFAGSPGDDMDRHSRGRQRARVVGHLPAPGVRLLDRGAKRAEPRGLRRLGRGHLVTLDRRHDTVAPDALQGVDDRHHRHHGALDSPTAAAAAIASTSSTLTAGRAASCTRTSVASSWPASGQRPQAGDHRVGPRLATGNDQAASIGRGQRVGEALDRIGRDGDRDAHRGRGWRAARRAPIAMSDGPRNRSTACRLPMRRLPPAATRMAAKRSRRRHRRERLSRRRFGAARRSCARRPSGARGSR